MRAWCAQLLGQVRRHRRVLTIALMLLIFVLMAWRLHRDWHNLPDGFLQSVDYAVLASSFVCLMAALLLVSTRWTVTLRAMGEPIPWRTSVRIWFLSQAGRYLPGGVWTYLGRFHLSQGKMGGDIAILSMVLETVLRVISEVLVFLASLPLWPERNLLDARIYPLLAVVALAGLGSLHPALLRRLASSPWLRRMGTRAEGRDPILPAYPTLLGLLAYYAVTVVAVGAAFYLLVQAIYPLSPGALPALTGALAISVVLGFLVPLAPSGWGVREGTLALLLGQIMPPSVAVVISIVCRLWLSLAEGVWILLASRL